MTRILMAGCSQEISTFNPVPCEYDLFSITRGDQIRQAAQGTNNSYGGAIYVYKGNYYSIKNNKI